ncbi:ATP-dependent helicase [Spiroplasma endosymbiont of Labia minor]|uniref:ATP-dependent helicase n=1 Tax=Spiroplasma endosymbiont of Labia minor TaxID=3066305 RepID=UPI0030CF009E
MTINDWLEKLNEKQLEAVKYVDSPLRIVAGAGAGKTRVITTKIAYLITSLGIQPKRILAVTFTNKATKEMRERLETMLADSYTSKPFVSTFHAMCVRILREDGLFVDLDSGFSIIDTDDQEKIVKNIILEMNSRNNSNSENIIQAKDIKKYTKKISHWKSDFLEPEELLESMYGNDKKAAGIYKRYEYELKRINATDFDGLLIKTHTLFNNFKDVRDKWKNRFDYVVVDEFQDTNQVQFDLIKWLCGEKNNLTVVGDPDQTIYSWRGAKLQIIMNFNKNFPTAKTIILDENYRSTKRILGLANEFIKHNKEREPKDIYTNNLTGEKPVLAKAFDSHSEAKWVVTNIKKLIQKDYKYRDIFILYRVNSWSRVIEHELKQANIPYNVRGGMQFRNRRVIKDITSLLRMIVFKDELSMIRVLEFTPKIGDVIINKLRSAAEIANLSLVDFIMQPEALTISKYIKELQYALNLSLTDYKNKMDLISLTKNIIKYFNYVDVVLKNRSTDLEADLLNIGAYYDQMGEYINSLDPTYTENPIINFLQTEVLGTTDNIEVNNAVTLLTIHSAKGLENKIVFVMGVNRGIFPSRMSYNSATQLEEERRALYVAMTRAEHKLYISFVDGEFSAQINEYLTASKFIAELDSEQLEVSEDITIKIDKPLYSNLNPKNNSNKFSQEKNDFILQERVNHIMFGNGIVIKIDNAVTTVAFDNPVYGVKTFIGSTPALSKI